MDERERERETTCREVLCPAYVSSSSNRRCADLGPTLSVTLPDHCFLEGSQASRVCPGESGSSPTVSADRDHGPTDRRPAPPQQIAYCVTKTQAVPRPSWLAMSCGVRTYAHVECNLIWVHKRITALTNVQRLIRSCTLHQISPTANNKCEIRTDTDTKWEIRTDLRQYVRITDRHRQTVSAKWRLETWLLERKLHLKVKLSLYKPWRHRGGGEVQLHSFLISGLMWMSGQLHAPPAVFRGRCSGLNWIGRRVEPTAGRAVWREDIPLSLPGIKPRSLGCPACSRDWAAARAQPRDVRRQGAQVTMNWHVNVRAVTQQHSFKDICRNFKRRCTVFLRRIAQHASTTGCPGGCRLSVPSGTG